MMTTFEQKMDSIGRLDDVPNDDNDDDNVKASGEDHDGTSFTTHSLVRMITSSSSSSTQKIVSESKPKNINDLDNTVSPQNDMRTAVQQAPTTHDNTTTTTTPSPSRQRGNVMPVLEAMEIGDPMEDVMIEEEDYLDDEDDDEEFTRDMERLLNETARSPNDGSSLSQNQSTKSSSSSPNNVTLSLSTCFWYVCCCGRSSSSSKNTIWKQNRHRQLQQRRIGNVTIVWPFMYQRTDGWGVIGPHWFGPPSVMVLLLFASSFFMERAYHQIGIITTLTCGVWTFCTLYNLINTAFRDPGVVKIEDSLSSSQTTTTTTPNHEQVASSLEGYRWCDLCHVYQPPDGAHCPDCNVCVAGYDHHCVWMGICIGRKNYRQFVAFNLSWLSYLAYAIVWVTFLGPAIYHHHRKH